MKLLVKFHPHALEELIQAAEYYESRAEGLGGHFLDAITGIENF